MNESEIAFLLRLMNKTFPDGHVDDSEPGSLTQSLIFNRFLALGLILEHWSTSTVSRWYVHHNDETGHWEK